jgi:putative SOS response-associated peptidase YedK
MPVVLEPDHADRWMSGDMALLDEYESIAPTLRAWPVDRKVNNARNESDDLIDAVGDTVS